MECLTWVKPNWISNRVLHHVMLQLLIFRSGGNLGTKWPHLCCRAFSTYFEWLAGVSNPSLHNKVWSVGPDHGWRDWGVWWMYQTLINDWVGHSAMFQGTKIFSTKNSSVAFLIYSQMVLVWLIQWQAINNNFLLGFLPDWVMIQMTGAWGSALLITCLPFIALESLKNIEKSSFSFVARTIASAYNAKYGKNITAHSMDKAMPWILHLKMKY